MSAPRGGSTGSNVGVPTPVQAGKGQLCDCFDEGETTTNKCVLSGPGCIGKSTLVRNFAAECAADGPLDTLRLVLVMLASTLEYDYLGLHAMPEVYEDGGSAAARLARPAQSEVRKVHALLGSPTWLGTMARHPRRPTGSRSDRSCKHGLAAQGVSVGRRPDNYHDARSSVDRRGGDERGV